MSVLKNMVAGAFSFIHSKLVAAVQYVIQEENTFRSRHSYDDGTEQNRTDGVEDD